MSIAYEEVDFKNDTSSTVSVIATCLPHFEVKVNTNVQRGWWTIELPRPPAAEYRFSLHGLVGGDRQIAAAPLARTGVHPPRFWYSPMEMADFRDDFSKLQDAFHVRVEGLLRYPTRIFEKKGVMWLSYWAEYESDSGWKRLGGISNLGLGLGVPFIGRKRIYTSPPLRSWVQQ